MIYEEHDDKYLWECLENLVVKGIDLRDRLGIKDVKPAPEYVICNECTMREDCENKEGLYGCYFGEKEEDADEAMGR